MRKMTRATGKYKILYMLEKCQDGYVLCVEKTTPNEKERVSFFINSSQSDCDELVRKLWACKVTPMSVEYILIDEGFDYKIIKN